MTTDQPSTSKPFRRWFQYSLRTLLIVVTLFAFACSWFAVKLGQAKRQREAVEEFSKLGGTIAYDYQLDASTKQNKEPPSPAWLRKILGDDFFHTVVYAHLENDASMLYLKDLSEIRRLNLSGSEITDKGLEQLKDLPQLQNLCLVGTTVTDPGLEHLRGLTQLQVLALDGTKVTDNVLEHLKELTQLKELGLYDTKVTDEGVKKLQQALPNCKIIR
jgi:Leucine-rich repeat (LRR) protein